MYMYKCPGSPMFPCVHYTSLPYPLPIYCPTIILEIVTIIMAILVNRVYITYMYSVGRFIFSFFGI